MRTGRVMLAGVMACSAVALTACEKPTPGISAFSGTDTVRTEALCWAYEEESLAPGDCARDIVSGNDFGSAPELPVRPGTVVGISVDVAVAEDGWVPSLGGQRLVNNPITETYFRFTFPQAELPDEGLGLQVLSGPQTQLRGVWAVRLVNP